MRGGICRGNDEVPERPVQGTHNRHNEIIHKRSHGAMWMQGGTNKIHNFVPETHKRGPFQKIGGNNIHAKEATRIRRGPTN
jgi:hypothetical protein